MKWSIVAFAKIFIPIGLVALGINGLVQVSLQHDMTVKSAKLNAQVGMAKTLSGQLHTGLSGLTTLKNTTEHMQTSLVQIQSSTANMASGLATLSVTVAGLETSIHNIRTGVQVSNGNIGSIDQTAKSVLSTLEQLASVNSDIVGNLHSMISDETAINHDLTQMNRKTSMIP